MVMFGNYSGSDLGIPETFERIQEMWNNGGNIDVKGGAVIAKKGESEVSIPVTTFINIIVQNGIDKPPIRLDEKSVREWLWGIRGAEINLTPAEVSLALSLAGFKKRFR